MLFSLYFLLNEIEKTKDYIEWYEKDFSDDIGKSIQKLHWALSRRRMNDHAGAKTMLAGTMLSNLYIIPKFLNEKQEEYDIWHSTSDQHIGYVEYTPKEVISLITKPELHWITSGV